MVDATQTRRVVEHKKIDRAVSTSSDGTEVEPASPALKSALTTSSQLQHEHLTDSEEDSYLSSETSEKAGRTAGVRTAARKAHDQDANSDDDSVAEDTSTANTSGHRTNLQPFSGVPGKINVKESGSGKQVVDVQQQKEALGNEESDAEGNDVVDEKSKLMAAAQAAGIPSDGSFSNKSGCSSPPARLISEVPPGLITRGGNETSRKVATLPTVADVLQGSDDTDSDEGTTLLSLESETESSSYDDDVSDEINEQQLTEEARINVNLNKIMDQRRRSTNYAHAREQDDDFDGPEHSDHSDAGKWKKVNRKVINSASFKATSTTSKWPSFKTKVFHSFRTRKTSAGSSSGDGSRIISVKNLAREVTDDILYDFFHDAGSILDIRITRHAEPGRSGPGSAFVEFKSGSAARKAAQKSGTNLGGRIISCGIVYEKSTGTRSAPGSGNRKKHESVLSKSQSASLTGRALENRSALGMFDPELQEGDAKFLSRFNEQFNVHSHGDDINPPLTGNRDDIHLTAVRLTKGRERGGMRNEWTSVPGRAHWFDSYGSPSTTGKTQGELEQSAYFDAEDLDSDAHVHERSKGRWTTCTAWPWMPWRSKENETGIPSAWRKPHSQWWHFAKHSIQRKPGTTSRPKVVDKRKKITGEGVGVSC